MKNKKNNFSKGVENLIDPITVGSLHFIQPFNQLLPKFLQRKITESSGKQTPYMGFVVEPYSSFLCYEITNTKKASKLLPKGFKLIKTKIFQHDQPKYYCIFGCFRAHTSAFWGSRVEFYIVAENISTGMLSWIIIDYDTNTISYDKEHGLRSPNTNKSIITINHQGRLFVEVENENMRKIAYDFNVNDAKMEKLDQNLWLNGNLSVGYGRKLSKNNADIFSLKFEPAEVEKALKIPVENFHLDSNNWYSDIIEKSPSQVVCFPYAQHFVSDSPGHSSNLKDKYELEQANSQLEFNKIEVFSTKSFKTMFILGSIFSFVITLTFFLLWIFK